MMNGLYTNRPGVDTVETLLRRLGKNATRLRLASPYFQHSELIESFSEMDNVSVQLIVGLNPSTNPYALASVLKNANVSVHYFTTGFHSKLYIFDDKAVVGSANLTYAGLRDNLETAIPLSKRDNAQLFAEIDEFFDFLWEQSQNLQSIDHFLENKEQEKADANVQADIEAIFGTVSANQKEAKSKNDDVSENNTVSPLKSDVKEIIKNRLFELGLPDHIRQEERQGEYLSYTCAKKGRTKIILGVNWNKKKRVFWPHLYVPQKQVNYLRSIKSQILQMSLLSGAELDTQSNKRLAYLKTYIHFNSDGTMPIDDVARATLELYKLSKYV